MRARREWNHVQTHGDKYLSATKSSFWSRASVSGHMERALRPDNPAYLRLADLALACAAPNGHAEFGHGELTKFLGAAYRVVDNAIVTAVEYGLLAEGSHKRCLRIPSLALPHAGAGSTSEKDARRNRACLTCRPLDLATCGHANRRRYVADGRCQSCYRKAKSH
jgi:hypothetical protein